MTYEQTLSSQLFEKRCGVKIIERMPDRYRLTRNDGKQFEIALSWGKGQKYEKLPILYLVK